MTTISISRKILAGNIGDQWPDQMTAARAYAARLETYYRDIAGHYAPDTQIDVVITVEPHEGSAGHVQVDADDLDLENKIQESLEIGEQREWARFCDLSLISDRMASGDANDLAVLLTEGEFRGINHSDTADRCCGYADWIAYLPSVNRGCWVSNGDPTWFDATSLDDAVEQVVSGADLIN